MQVIKTQFGTIDRIIRSPTFLRAEDCGGYLLNGIANKLNDEAKTVVKSGIAAFGNSDPLFSVVEGKLRSTVSKLRVCGLLGVGAAESDPPHVVGKTAAEMQTASTFLDAGWDFETIWMICEGKDYPRLRWENARCEE